MQDSFIYIKVIKDSKKSIQNIILLKNILNTSLSFIFKSKFSKQ